MLRNIRGPLSHVPPRYECVNPVRDKPLKEITKFQNKLDNIDASPCQNNLAAARFFKEIMYSHNDLLDNLYR